ncbi:Malonyl CoA-acyl carrier protein transacylase [compost metagenome]
MSKIALLFPGQGSQYVGMGKGLIDNYAVARQTFEEASDVLGYDLPKQCLEGPDAVLTNTAQAQPAILTMSVAAYRVFRQEFGLTPSVAAGHSLGEFSALTVAEVFSFSDAVNLVRQRGLLMDEANTLGDGAMLAISQAELSSIEEACRIISDQTGLTATISCFNAPDQFTVSGNRIAIEQLNDRVTGMFPNVKTTRLNVSAAFHCSLMSSIVDRFMQVISNIPLHSPVFPVLSNVTGLPHGDADSIVHNLVRQLTEPVRWTDNMSHMLQEEQVVFMELGPKSVLRNLARKVTSRPSFAYDNTDSLESMRTELGRYTPFGLISKTLAIAVSIKNREFDTSLYEVGVIRPYQAVKSRLMQLESEGRQPEGEDIRQALDMLTSVLRTKQAPSSEALFRTEQLQEQWGQMPEVAEWVNELREIYQMRGDLLHA